MIYFLPTIITAALFAGVIWCWAHEDRFIEFEEWAWAKIKRRIRIWKRNICAKWLAKDGLTVVPNTASFEDVLPELIGDDK